MATAIAPRPQEHQPALPSKPRRARRSAGVPTPCAPPDDPETAAVRAVLHRFPRGVQALVESWFRARAAGLPAGLELHIEVWKGDDPRRDRQLACELAATAHVPGLAPVVVKFERMFDTRLGMDHDLVNLAVDTANGGCVGDVSGFVSAGDAMACGLAMVVAISALSGAAHDIGFAAPVNGSAAEVTHG